MRKYILPFITFSLFLYLFSGQAIVIGFLISSLWLIANHLRLMPSAYLLMQLKKPVFASWFVFLLIASLSSTWAINPAESRATALSIVGMSIIGFLSYCASHSYNKKIELHFKLLIAALIAINLIMIIEHLTGYSLTLKLRHLLHLSVNTMGEPLDKATALFTLLLPFLYFSAADKSPLFKVLIIITLISYAVHPMQAAQLALIFSIITMGSYRIMGKNFIYLFFSILGFMLVASPLIYRNLADKEKVLELAPNFPEGWQQRLDMWQKTSIIIEKEPILGWGIKSSRFIGNSVPEAGSAVIQLHPHNMFLQLWLETGAIGVSVLCIFLFSICRLLLRQHDREFVMCCLGSLAAFTIFALISFGAWQHWWFASIWIMIFIMQLFLVRITDRSHA